MGESIGFVSGKIKKIIADFHVLGFFIFISKRHDLSNKKFSSVTRKTNLLPSLQLPPKKLES
jgi:hypothetical protein